MLRTISTDVPFRGLHQTPFEVDGVRCVLGKRTVVYGRNGAGKTSLSELLRLGSAAAQVEQATVSASLREAEGNQNRLLHDSVFPLDILVYNRFYVADSLALFLDGTGTSEPILKLGKVNVDAANRIALFRAVEERLARWKAQVVSAQKQRSAAVSAAEVAVKLEVIEHLGPGDPGTYGTATYRVDRVRKIFVANQGGKRLSPEIFDNQVLTARSALKSTLRVPSSHPSFDQNFFSRALLALTRAVDSVPLADLRSDKAREDWTEDGLNLHISGEACRFCRDGIVTEEVLSAYRLHFSSALKELRSELAALVAQTQQVIDRSTSWSEQLPDRTDLLPEYQRAYDLAIETFDSVRRSNIEERKTLIGLLEERLSDLLSPISLHRVTPGFAPPVDSSELEALLTANNNACANFKNLKQQAQTAVEVHVAAEHYDEHVSAKNRAAVAERCLVALERHLVNVRRDISDLENSQQDTGIMADRINVDLKDHFGHDHLSISVSADGKGYRVMRSGEVASSLSEGERNAIAFSYFLESLDAEGRNPRKSLVVVDDPVTSMDKEALFAAFALAEDRTEATHQTIFLTHDYEYFRLQVRQRKSALDKSRRKIAEGDLKEEAFPAVSILEMVARISTTGGRVSSLRPLSQSLLRHPSEYHYLFSKVANAVALGADDELPLLGNAARRLIEGFITFRAPHAQDFQARIDSIVRESSIDTTLSRRLVKFLHGQSHREEPNPESALDFPAIDSELRTVLDFMRRADAEHFSNMCTSVGIPETHFLANDAVQPAKSPK